MGSHVFSQHSGVGVGVVTADDDDGGQAVLLRHFGHDFELFFRFQFGTAGTDDIETAGVPVGVDVLVGEFDVVVIDQSGGAALEAEQDVILVGGLDGVIQTADDVVSAGGLSAGKDHTHNLLLGGGGVAALDEGDFFLAVGVGEEGFDLGLVCYALGGRADFDADLRDAATKHSGKLGAVLISCFLKG